MSERTMAQIPNRDPASFIPLKPDLFHILLALSEQELHGYAIMKAVEEATAGQIVLDPSPLYRRLKRLVDLGIVVESGKRPVAESDDERRRYYRLTAFGRRVLVADAARLVALSNTSSVQALAAKAK
jgi:DNA-binding PadR family transcriptional regulator